jgi:hypothetical protein
MKRAELLEDPVGLHQDAPEPVGVFAVIRSVCLVLVEADGIGHFVGFRVDVDRQAELVQLLHEARVERRHRLRLQCDRSDAAVARLYGHLVTHEVEVDLERSVAMRNRRRRESSGGDV